MPNSQTIEFKGQMDCSRSLTSVKYFPRFNAAAALFLGAIENSIHGTRKKLLQAEQMFPNGAPWNPLDSRERVAAQRGFKHQKGRLNLAIQAQSGPIEIIGSGWLGFGVPAKAAFNLIFRSFSGGIFLMTGFLVKKICSSMAK
jgi:hypothetical protein